MLKKSGYTVLKDCNKYLGLDLKVTSCLVQLCKRTTRITDQQQALDVMQDLIRVMDSFNVTWYDQPSIIDADTIAMNVGKGQIVWDGITGTFGFMTLQMLQDLRNHMHRRDNAKDMIQIHIWVTVEQNELLKQTDNRSQFIRDLLERELITK